MLAPATIVVTIGIVIPIVILFRYSLNQFTPAKVMVDAFTARHSREGRNPVSFARKSLGPRVRGDDEQPSTCRSFSP